MNNSQLTQGNYGGIITKKIQTSGVILTTTNYDPYLNIPLHYHENSVVTCVRSGLYTERAGSQEISCTYNSFIYHRPAIEHSNQFLNKQAGCFNIELMQPWLESFEIKKVKFADICVVKDTSLSNLVDKLILEFNINDTASGLIIDGLTIEILGRIYRQSKADKIKPVWLSTVQELLHEHFVENLSLEYLTEATGMSPFHIVREFKKHCGTTIGAYLTRLRINHACTLLAQKDYSLVRVGLECGFSDQSHFGNTFKKVMGLTPLAYRKTAISS